MRFCDEYSIGRICDKCNNQAIENKGNEANLNLLERVHLGASKLNNSRRTMNNFSRVINCFYKNNIYYGDTDSLYIEKKIGIC